VLKNEFSNRYAIPLRRSITHSCIPLDCSSLQVLVTVQHVDVLRLVLVVVVVVVEA
jgi:hypothetical protein